MKRKAIIFSLLIIWVPFVFITDFYPLMRVGMFAEPVRTEAQLERFKIYYYDADNNKQIFNSEAIGLAPYVFEQLTKNYFYRGEGELLLQKVSEKSLYKTWELERTSGTDSTTYIQYSRK